MDIKAIDYIADLILNLYVGILQLCLQMKCLLTIQIAAMNASLLSVLLVFSM